MLSFSHLGSFKLKKEHLFLTKIIGNYCLSLRIIERHLISSLVINWSSRAIWGDGYGLLKGIRIYLRNIWHFLGLLEVTGSNLGWLTFLVFIEGSLETHWMSLDIVKVHQSLLELLGVFVTVVVKKILVLKICW